MQVTLTWILYLKVNLVTTCHKSGGGGLRPSLCFEIKKDKGIDSATRLLLVKCYGNKIVKLLGLSSIASVVPNPLGPKSQHPVFKQCWSHLASKLSEIYHFGQLFWSHLDQLQVLAPGPVPVVGNLCTTGQIFSTIIRNSVIHSQVIEKLSGRIFNCWFFLTLFMFRMYVSSIFIMSIGIFQE